MSIFRADFSTHQRAYITKEWLLLLFLFVRLNLSLMLEMYVSLFFSGFSLTPKEWHLIDNIISFNLFDIRICASFDKSPSVYVPITRNLIQRANHYRNIKTDLNENASRVYQKLLKLIVIIFWIVHDHAICNPEWKKKHLKICWIMKKKTMAQKKKKNKHTAFSPSATE